MKKFVEKFIKDFGDPWPMVALAGVPILIVIVLKLLGWID